MLNKDKNNTGQLLAFSRHNTGRAAGGYQPAAPRAGEDARKLDTDRSQDPACSHENSS